MPSFTLNLRTKKKGYGERRAEKRFGVWNQYFGIKASSFPFLAS